jgi:enoyl-CoA hydratase/carnithine racemase
MTSSLLNQRSTSPQLTIQGAVATLRLCNPDYANRLSPTDLANIQSHIKLVNDRPEVMVLRVLAEGKYFCSGYDISSLAAESAPSSLYFGETVDLLEQARPVTIAAINGGVYGGGTDLSLACDFRLGSTASDMFMPAAKLGLHFYPGGMVRYITRLGLNHTKRLFLTAEKINAAEMKEIGFLTDLVEPEKLNARVDQLTQQLAGMAPLALLGIKKHLNLIARGQIDESAIAQAVLHSEQSDDIKEGAAAWKEKRQAIFQGR